MTAACGIDFGTTNSSIAVNVDGEVRVVPLDDDLPYLRSQLFLHRDGDRSCGNRSTRRYLNESQYRTRCAACDRTPDRFIAPLGGSVTWLPHGCRQYQPGGGCSDARLLRGVKAELPDLHLTRTTSWAIEYSIESLVAILMEEVKRRAELSVGRPITRVVLGRPVVLGQTEEEDQLVEDRLLRAAQLAGFEELAVCPEPVAAALEPVFGPARGRILSLDFGGGTFDAAILLLHEDDGMLDPELEGSGVRTSAATWSTASSSTASSPTTLDSRRANSSSASVFPTGSGPGSRPGPAWCGWPPTRPSTSCSGAASAHREPPARWCASGT